MKARLELRLPPLRRNSMNEKLPPKFGALTSVTIPLVRCAAVEVIFGCLVPALNCFSPDARVPSCQVLAAFSNEKGAPSNPRKTRAPSIEVRGRRWLCLIVLTTVVFVATRPLSSFSVSTSDLLRCREFVVAPAEQQHEDDRP